MPNNDIDKHPIVPITFIDDVEYNVTNNKKNYNVNVNELFVNPYDVNTLYRPTTTVEPTDRIVEAYNDSIKRSKVAFLQMNVEDIVVNIMLELISDIFEPEKADNTLVQNLFIDRFITNMYIHNIIADELKEVEYIDITLCNLYTRIVADIVDPFVVMVTNIMIRDYQDICKNIYKRYVEDGESDSVEKFNTVSNSYGNALYCHIISVIRDIAEYKVSGIRSLFDVIKQTYLNMGQFASDYHIDPETKKIVSSDMGYYNHLMESKFNIGG